MGNKLYKQDEAGIRFESTRRPGEVRIPNYVYDLWLPLLGATYIGVYSMYCRLERQENVTGMSNQRIAKICKIGTTKLGDINRDLEALGFIKTTKPTGAEKVKHFTTVITVCDPPKAITPEIIREYGSEDNYEPLSTWLIEGEPNSQIGISYSHSQIPNGNASLPKQECDTIPNGNASIEPSNLQPLSLQPFNTPHTPAPIGLGSDETPKPEPVKSSDPAKIQAMYDKLHAEADSTDSDHSEEKSQPTAGVATPPTPPVPPPPPAEKLDMTHLRDVVANKWFGFTSPKYAANAPTKTLVRIDAIVDAIVESLPDATDDKQAAAALAFCTFWGTKQDRNGKKLALPKYDDTFGTQWRLWLADNPQITKQATPTPAPVATYDFDDDEPFVPLKMPPPPPKPLSKFELNWLAKASEK